MSEYRRSAAAEAIVCCDDGVVGGDGEDGHGVESVVDRRRFEVGDRRDGLQ
jgi:hypothetical protein